MRAGEAAGTDNLHNRADFNADGIVNMVDFAILGGSWRAHNPSEPFDPNFWPNTRWNVTANLYNDYIIDFKDLRLFCQGSPPYTGYPWIACWYKMPANPQPSPSYTPEPNEPYYDPNEPFDPNGFGDPNDPNGFGMSMMGQSNQMSLSAGTRPMVAELGITARQLQDCINFLYEVAAEGSPEDAAVLYEIIPTLEQELSDIYGTQPMYDSTQ
jgi:hypothetical protein